MRCRQAVGPDWPPIRGDDLNSRPRVLAVIPARGGSKGIPAKNLRDFAGLPLIAHSILMARMTPEIDRVIVSTDSRVIADEAMRYGAEVPFLRPDELARDETPMWPVVVHALTEAERSGGASFDAVVLLDPTSPGRMPSDVAEALDILRDRPEADGVFSVSRPDFNPLWVCVVERDGWMQDLLPGAHEYTRRQDLPTVFRINAVLYAWRAEYVRDPSSTVRGGRIAVLEIPEVRAMHIDDEAGLLLSQARVRDGLVKFPWLGTFNE